ncbi:hypothetical protein AN958_07446 [Leucoagaricus sp. SymC.cos]|nr:hypothetical protein AN958_07446 [Leucoagaricus sp. SymC.cos]
MQYCLYLNSSQAKKDKRVVRGIVHFLFLLDAAQSILAMVDAFHWFVYNFGNYDALHDVEMSGIDGPLLDSIIALIVQFTYCWRIWVLSRQRGLLRTLLPTIIALLALASCVGGSMRGIEGSVVKRTPGVSGVTGHLDKFETILWNAAGSAADVLIALSMAYLLLSFGTENTDRGFLRKVRLIVIFTLETNLLTTILAIVNMVVVVIKPIGPPV